MEINTSDIILTAFWFVIWYGFGAGIFEAQKQGVYLRIERLKDTLHSLDNERYAAEAEYREDIGRLQRFIQSDKETLRGETLLYNANAENIKSYEKEIRELEDKLGITDDNRFEVETTDE